MSRRALLRLLVLVALLGSGACNRDGSSAASRLRLDGSARVPDAEGVVRDVDRNHLTLEGGRTYRLTPELQSFNSHTLAAMSVLQRKGEYVQLGVDDGTAVWVAAIGAVVPLDRPTVFFQGKVARTSKGRVVFRDGTVLRLGDGISAPNGALVRAELDPSTRRVTALVPL